MGEPRVRSVGPETDLQAGLTIRRLREARGWSLQDLSFGIWDITGEEISVAVLRMMEDEGRDRRITLGEAKVIAATLGVTIDTLVKGMR